MQEKLKKFGPYILPLLALIFVAVMFIRWYGGKTANKPEGSLISNELEVTSLSQDEEESIIKGTADFSTVEMLALGNASGEVRYQLMGEKLNFTVTANLPDNSEPFAVWLKEVNGDARKRVFVLDYSKAGYIGSASVPADVLPVEVVVSTESDLLLEDALLRGMIEE